MRIARLCVAALVATLLTFVSPASAHAADGDFIRVYPDDLGGPVYRIAGGAPIYVTTWEAAGQPATGAPYTDVSQAYFDTLPPYPADGTVVNDGVQTYRYAGGAPIVVTNWANIGGEQPSIRIDPGAIASPGKGRWSRLRAQPLDGTQIVGGLPGDPEDGSVFVIAGGAPIYVADFAAVGGSRSPVLVDMSAVRNAGTSQAAFSHLSFVPPDGTQVNAGGTCYRISGGVAIAGAAGACGTRIDPAAIVRAGQPGRWSHLTAAPPPPPAPTVPPPVPTPAPVIRTIKLTVIKKSKLKVDIGPDAAGSDYEFVVEVRQRRNKWRFWVGSLTGGPKDVKRINLPRGKYRVVLPEYPGVPAITSRVVKIKR